MAALQQAYLSQASRSVHFYDVVAVKAGSEFTVIFVTDNKHQRRASSVIKMIQHDKCKTAARRLPLKRRVSFLLNKWDRYSFIDSFYWSFDEFVCRHLSFKLQINRTAAGKQSLKCWRPFTHPRPEIQTRTWPWHTGPKFAGLWYVISPLLLKMTTQHLKDTNTSHTKDNLIALFWRKQQLLRRCICVCELFSCGRCVRGVNRKSRRQNRLYWARSVGPKTLKNLAWFLFQFTPDSLSGCCEVSVVVITQRMSVLLGYF